MPDTSEDIPPPPVSSPPSPPDYNCGPAPKGYGAARPGFTHNSPGAAKTAGTLRRGYFRQSSEQFESTRCRGRAPVPENPYSEVGQRALYVPAKPARRKGMLVKQPNVEDSPEKTSRAPPSPAGAAPTPAAPAERSCSSIAIPTIIVKEPSTSSSGKSSQGSSVEAEPTTPERTPLAPGGGGGGLRPDGPMSPGNPFAAAIAGAVRDRERRLEARRHSGAFQSIDAGDEEPGEPPPAPRLRHSKSIDEGMFGGAERLRRILGPPPPPLGPPVGGGGGNVTDFNSPEPTVVREPLNTRTGQCPDLGGPASLPATPPTGHHGADGTYLHPVTGKPLDHNSPLALALAARDRAMGEQQGRPQAPPPARGQQEAPPLPLRPGLKDLDQPLFIDTKLRSRIETSFAAVSSAAAGRPGRGALRRQLTEQKYESDGAREERRHRPVEERRSAPAGVTDAAQPAGLLMVHTCRGRRPEGEGPDGDRPAELKDGERPEPPHAAAPGARPQLAASQRRSVPVGVSVEEPAKLPFRMPPPPLASVDIDDDFDFTEPLPPPLEFANSVDIPDEQAGAIAEMLLLQRRNGGPSLPPYLPHAPPPATDLQRRAPAYPPPPPDSEAGLGDSGAEEADPQLADATSAVSSLSTLSSEGGFCDGALESLYGAADGHAFLVDRPPVAPKPKGKSVLHRTPLYHDALIEEPPESYGSPPQAPPPPPVTSDPPRTPTQRTSKLWGDRPPEPEPRSTVTAELSAILQQMSRESRESPASPPGAGAGCRAR
ncbi:SH3 and multiple ankyrin repeat domains protein 2 [Liparis tanakae]|uniref:SH3 and multiple ankyrin repeat domains protein 2 n=1 Tax=Liparis tanakae TaxID=230148 RepID=A0A4Z2EG81_9TELE|nr:SH3 and multiple ankyrin repeat domains protein 2 [Liparis tanakae]